MKVRTRRHLGGNRYEITVTLEDGEDVPTFGSERGLDDMGVVRFDNVRYIGPEAWLTVEDRLYAAEVATLETIGPLYDR